MKLETENPGWTDGRTAIAIPYGRIKEIMVGYKFMKSFLFKQSYMNETDYTCLDFIKSAIFILGTRKFKVTEIN